MGGWSSRVVKGWAGSTDISAREILISCASSSSCANPSDRRRKVDERNGRPRDTDL
jgi:hypothetical protein